MFSVSPNDKILFHVLVLQSIKESWKKQTQTAGTLMMSFVFLALHLGLQFEIKLKLENFIFYGRSYPFGDVAWRVG